LQFLCTTGKLDFVTLGLDGRSLSRGLREASLRASHDNLLIYAYCNHAAAASLIIDALPP